MHSLDYAIQTEVDGVKFYSEQSLKNKGTTLQKVFDLLADEERQHEIILRRIMSDTFSELAENGSMLDKKSIFADLVDFKDEIREHPHQVEVYRLARGMEEKSIALYKKMLEEAKNDIEKSVIQYLVTQETYHYQLMDEFVIRIGRPDEWVESAEFGEREEY